MAPVDHAGFCRPAGVAFAPTLSFEHHSKGGPGAQEHEGLEQGPLYDPRLGPRHHSNGSPEALLEEMKFNVTAQARRAGRAPGACCLALRTRVCAWQGHDKIKFMTPQGAAS